MGISSIAKLTSNPKIEEIVHFMQTNKVFSNIIVNERPPETYNYTNDKGEKMISENEHSGRISFSFETKDHSKVDRGLFVLANYIDKTVNSSTTPFLDKKYTFISLGRNGSSQEVIEAITNEFGGFVVLDDCADEDSEDFFYPINGKKESVFPAATQSLFDSLVGMNLNEKYLFVKHIEANKKLISDFIAQ